MNTINVTKQNSAATITLNRGKVNAVNNELIDEFQETLIALRNDDSIKFLIITGSEKFFSFGFDVPELLSYDDQELRTTLTAFCELYGTLYLFDKPVIAALNGHTMAAGCVIALTADYRIMAGSGGKIALNEVSIGSNIFAGAVSMLVNCIGQRKAEQMLLTGNMCTAEQALELGLIDSIVISEELLESAEQFGQKLASAPAEAFAIHKQTLRGPLVSSWQEKEEVSIQQMLKLWASPKMREQLAKVQIRK